jgi:hypothetical protein
VALLRRLADGDPVAHAWKLPGALNELGQRFTAPGLREDAAAAVEEAAAIERGLATPSAPGR